jgi:hypothetical protein
MSFSHTLPGQESKRCFARFFMDKDINNFRSKQEGRTVFDDVEMVEIIIPGDSKTQVVTRVTDRHRHEWAREYEAFKNGLEPAVQGYPIEHWPPLTAAMAANFKARAVHTVEALASVSDANLANLGLGARQWRERAQAWLQQAENGKAVDEMMSQRDEARAELNVLKSQYADLSAAVEKLQARRTKAILNDDE